MRIIRHLVSLVSSAVLLVGVAHAQGRAPSLPGERNVAPEPSAEEQDPAARAGAADPNLDRSLLLPTAMTQPKGSLTYSNYELALHGLTYGFTDRLQASLTILPPYVEDVPFFAVLSVKGQVVRTDLFHMALQGSVTLTNIDDRSATAFSGGVLASACLSSDCASLVSVGLTALLSNQSEDYLLAYSGSLTQRLSAHTKLLVEVVSAAYHDSDTGYHGAPGALLNYGIRLHGHNFAGDIGFMRPVGFDGDSEIVMGIPFLNFTYRTN